MGQFQHEPQPENGSMAAGESGGSIIPRLLVFCQDIVVDGDPFASCYRSVAVGFRWSDGSCVTVQEAAPGGPPSITVWPTVDDAVSGLDAYVSTFVPHRSTAHLDADPHADRWFASQASGSHS